MLKATAGIMLPTTITGSLPRPSWYTENLGTRSFLDAMVTSRFREQYVDALSVYLREQEVAGLDIVTDGDCRFDQDIGGQSWTSYPPHHMERVRDAASRSWRRWARAGIAFPRGHILHDYLEARVMPKLVGPVGRGEMQYAEMFKAAQRHDDQAGEVRDGDAGAGGVRGAGRALQGHPVADHGAQRCVQRGAARPGGCRLPGDPDGGAADPPAGRAQLRGQGDQSRVHAEGVQQHGEGPAGEDRGVVPHVLGEPVAAADVRGGAELQAGAGAAEPGGCGRDHVRDEELERDGPRGGGAAITEKKVCIGAIDHHTLQVESPTEVADLIRQALKVIPAERLVLSSDCGMGREGMSRRHAFYKMVALVQGTNIVRKELGLPVAESLGADPKFSLIRS